MFGPRITTVFRSRWRALWWALSVLAGVYWSIPRDHGQDDRKDAEAMAALLQQQQPAQPAKHVNPWAKTPQ